jgi:hypothetical protein
MTLVYYNAIANEIFVIESVESASLSMYYVLCCEKNQKHGWVYLGEL